MYFSVMRGLFRALKLRQVTQFSDCLLGVLVQVRKMPRAIQGSKLKFFVLKEYKEIIYGQVNESENDHEHVKSNSGALDNCDCSDPATATMVAMYRCTAGNLFSIFLFSFFMNQRIHSCIVILGIIETFDKRVNP